MAGTDNLDIWVKQVDGGDPLRLTSDSADEYEPSFSADGNRIVFRSERDGGGIYTIPSLGGEPRVIAKGGREPRFSPDGTRIAFVIGGGGLNGAASGPIPSTLGPSGRVQKPSPSFIRMARGCRCATRTKSRGRCTSPATESCSIKARSPATSG